MRLDDRLAMQQRRGKKQGNPAPEEEETLTYRTYRREGALNEEQGVFKGKTFEGINTQQSIFDRTAIFHSKTGQ